jgi:hypothetical protein
MRRLWRDYSLSIVLGALFLGTWALHAWTGWMHFVAEQQSHGETAEVLGAGGYVWRWAEGTFENWQSEFLQLLSFVVLTSFLVHKGSHESKDSSEAMQRSLDRIEARLARLEPPAPRPVDPAYLRPRLHVGAAPEAPEAIAAPHNGHGH